MGSGPDGRWKKRGWVSISAVRIGVTVTPAPSLPPGSGRLARLGWMAGAMHRRVAPRMVPRPCCAPGCSRASSSPPRAAPPTWRPPATRWARPRWRSRSTWATRTPSPPRPRRWAPWTPSCATPPRRSPRPGAGWRASAPAWTAPGTRRGRWPTRPGSPATAASSCSSARARATAPTRARSAPPWRTRRGRCRSSGRATRSAPRPSCPATPPATTTSPARGLPRLAGGRLLQRLRVRDGPVAGLGFGAHPLVKEAALAGGRFGATVVIDRPIDEVFAFLADGENDPKFSSRVLEIAQDDRRAARRRDRLRQHGQGRRRQVQARVPADRVRAADEDPLGGDVHRSRRHPRGRLRPRPGGRGNAADLLQRARAGQLHGQAHRRLRAALGAQGRRRLRARRSSGRSRARSPRPASAGRAARARWRRAGRGSAACWAAGARPRRAGRR